MKGYYRAKRTSDNLQGMEMKWLVWGALQPLKPNCDCTSEPAEPVYFQFGQTRREALRVLKLEMEAIEGVTSWKGSR